MVSQYGIKLAVHLIQSYFGDTNAKVCECLLRRGTLSLSQIVQHTKLRTVNVRNALLVLIQQNCVQAFSIQHQGEFEELPRIMTQYMALFDYIIHHLRFPKFLAIVSKELDTKCEEVFEGFLQHGRLSREKVVDRRRGSYKGEENIAVECFNKLVAARFIERCPAHEPFLEPPDKDELFAKKSQPKSAKNAKIQTLEERALAAAALVESQRFSVADLDDVPGQNSMENSNTGNRGKKRKVDSLEPDLGVLATNERREVLWRVNIEEFLRRFRNKACIDNVRNRFDDSAGIVLNAIFEAARREETSIEMGTPGSLSINQVFEEVIRSEEGRRMTLEHVRASLVQLGYDTLEIECDQNNDLLKKIIELAQNEEVESIVQNRYGANSYRVFRLMSQRGRLLETGQISDIAFLEKNDTLKILYQLWRDDYVHLEKIPAAGDKGADVLLWKVNKQTLWVHVLDDMYHAALNLKLRLAVELEKESEILKIPADKLEGDLRARRLRLRKTRIVLESSLMKLDDAIMLLQYF